MVCLRCHCGGAPSSDRLRYPPCTPSFALQSYSRDVLVFIFGVLTCVAFGSSLTAVKAPSLLNRSQTEEWKGWMQVRGRRGVNSSTNLRGRGGWGRRLSGLDTCQLS